MTALPFLFTTPVIWPLPLVSFCVIELIVNVFLPILNEISDEAAPTPMLPVGWSVSVTVPWPSGNVPPVLVFGFAPVVLTVSLWELARVLKSTFQVTAVDRGRAGCRRRHEHGGERGSGDQQADARAGG